MWRTTRLKMCWAGGWCLNRALSYLCFSVEQGEKKSSVRGAPDFSKYCLFIFKQRWKRLHLFPSPYFTLHQYFHVSQSFSSDSMGSDSGITSRGWCIHFPLLRRPSSGPNWYLRRASYSIPYFTDDLNVCRDHHIFRSHSTVI